MAPSRTDEAGVTGVTAASIVTRRTAQRRGLGLTALIGLAVLTAPAPVRAQVVKEGQADVIHTYTIADRTMKMGERTVIQREFTGVSVNEKGSGMFHNLGMRCVSLIDVIDGKNYASGRCVEADADGDQIFHTFENKAGAGAHILIGGTGKYQGITGQQAFGAVRTVKGPDGVTALIVSVKASWKIP